MAPQLEKYSDEVWRCIRPWHRRYCCTPQNGVNTEPTLSKEQQTLSPNDTPLSRNIVRHKFGHTLVSPDKIGKKTAARLRRNMPAIDHTDAGLHKMKHVRIRDMGVGDSSGLVRFYFLRIRSFGDERDAARLSTDSGAVDTCTRHRSITLSRTTPCRHCCGNTHPCQNSVLVATVQPQTGTGGKQNHQRAAGP